MAEFNQFNFHNDNGIAAKVTLEAPIGTTVISGRTIQADGDVQVPFALTNVSSVKLSVVADADNHEPDAYTVDMTRAATPYPLYITSFTAHSGIGRIAGQISLELGRRSHPKINSSRGPEKFTGETCRPNRYAVPKLCRFFAIIFT
jgi:hypothetical protein